MGDRSLVWSTTIFGQQEHMKQYRDCQICAKNVYRPTMSKDFDVRWDQGLLSGRETPAATVLKGLYETKLQILFSFRLYWIKKQFETMGNPSYQRLKASVRLLTDQTMRTQTIQSLEWNFGKRSKFQESQRKESLRWEESRRMLSTDWKWTVCQRRLL